MVGVVDSAFGGEPVPEVLDPGGSLNSHLHVVGSPVGSDLDGSPVGSEVHRDGFAGGDDLAVVGDLDGVACVGDRDGEHPGPLGCVGASRGVELEDR